MPPSRLFALFAIIALLSASPSIAQMRLAELGADAPTPHAKQIDAGTVELVATGKEAYLGSDEGTFAGIETDRSYFTFIARVASVEGDASRAKIGVCVRHDLSKHARSVHLRYDSYDKHRCLQWFMRYQRRPSDHDGSRQCFHDGIDTRFDQLQGTWLKIERRYPYVRLSASRDGKEWSRVEGGYEAVLLPQKVVVGVIATQGGDGKPGARVTFDNIAFTADAANTDAGVETHDALTEFWPATGKWRFVSATVPMTDKGGKDISFNAQLLMPEKMTPRDIKGIIWSTGSKEFVLADNKPMEYVKTGPNMTLRQPKVMHTIEGSVLLDEVGPWNQWFASNGWVRVAGYFPPEHYDAAIKRLAEVSGIEKLPRLPFVSTGASFAGGYAATAGSRYPDRCVATAPVIIGQSGSGAESAVTVPFLNIWGSRDGPHMKDFERVAGSFASRKAQFGNAPMWTLAHRQHNAWAIALPFFMDTWSLRVPADADASAGPITLKNIPYEQGWYGLVDSWTTNAPRVMRVADYQGAPENAVWLPGERTARVWQAFVSQNPRPVILFPTFDGTSTFGGPMPGDWRVSQMKANTPFPIVAAGPTVDAQGKPIRVRWFADGQPLEAKPTGEHPYRATASGIRPGLHAIWLETYTDQDPGPIEISRPVLTLFVPSEGFAFAR